MYVVINLPDAQNVNTSAYRRFIEALDSSQLDYEVIEVSDTDTGERK